MGDVVDYPANTAGRLYLDAAFEYTVSRDTEIVNLICLVSGEPPQLEEMDCIANSSLSEYSCCRLCDVVVHCCYSLGKDLKLQSGNRVQAVAENTTEARPTSEGRRAASQLLGILADDAAWRRLATHSDRAKCARTVIRVVKASKFDGVHLLAPRRERSARGFYDFVFYDLVVGLAADVAARLQKENYSFGFFLPQGALGTRSLHNSAEEDPERPTQRAFLPRFFGVLEDCCRRQVATTAGSARSLNERDHGERDRLEKRQFRLLRSRAGGGRISQAWWALRSIEIAECSS
ncbi:hypothetical protein V5799_008369 [Amblyomma americanum]|uniref:Uncharacterized protein n=1 Tax=Amblyomma americanum TaxID=6943 RepID=A0AAQ4FEY0_AMBAM